MPQKYTPSALIIEVTTVFNSNNRYYDLEDSPTLKALFPDGNIDWAWLRALYPAVTEVDEYVHDWADKMSDNTLGLFGSQMEVYPYEFFLYPEGLELLQQLKQS